MKRIISAVQPSGSIQLGNYLGLMIDWLELTKNYQSLLFIADLHAVTNLHKLQDLKAQTIHTAICYLACGINPNNSIIFVQSAIKAHTELSWLLSCVTPVGWLNRMIQFKEKVSNSNIASSLGLYSYPVLQAADILLYQPDLVPVGEDQKQHLELTRDIALAFNKQFDTNYFKVPLPLITTLTSRIMSLRDGKKKMSKSDESDYSRINLIDNEEIIIKKIKKAKTDSITELSYEPDLRPEISNLIKIYAKLSNYSIEQVINKFKANNTKYFKDELSQLLIDKITPIGQKIRNLQANQDYVIDLLNIGNEQANEIAQSTLVEVKRLLKFFN